MLRKQRLHHSAQTPASRSPGIDGPAAIAAQNSSGTNTFSAPTILARRQRHHPEYHASHRAERCRFPGSMTSSTSPTVAFNGGGTVNLTNTDTYTAATTISGAGTTVKISGSGSLNTQTTSGGREYAAATLPWKAPPPRSLTAPIVAAGGTISVATATIDTDQSVGALTMSQSSIIDFGGAVGGETLRFASSTGTWTGTLSVINYTVGVDHLFFGSTTGTGVPTGGLSQIQFFSGSTVDTFIGSGNFAPAGEVSPVPEPSSVAIGVGLLGMIGIRERRRVGLILGRW